MTGEKKNVSRILVFAGSTRKGSFNRKLAAEVARLAEEEVLAVGREGAVEVRLVELSDYPMPLYNGDIEKEEGIPEAAGNWKDLLAEHDGLIIASPEYNSGYSPLIKNAIDWASRPASKDEPSLASFRNKTALLLAASPGGLGGLRGLFQLRSVLQNIGVTVLPSPHLIAVSSAHEAFDEHGRLKEKKREDSVRDAVAALIAVLERSVES